MQTENISKRKLEYKWIIAGVCFLMVMVGLGFSSSAKSIYISAITDALSLSRSVFSINDSCRYITVAIITIFFDVFLKKFGTKKLIGAGMIFLVLSSLIYSCATSMILFCIGGVFLGVGVAFTTTTMVGVVVNRWFTKNTGTIMGIILASNGLGAAIAIHITTPIIYQEGNPFGYQDAYRLTALILLLVTIVVMAFYKERPDAAGSCEYKAESEESVENRSEKETESLFRNPFFYCIVTCVFLQILVGVSSIVTPHLTDVGLEPSFVSSSLSMMVVLLAIFKFMIGFMFDRYGLLVSINICWIARIVSNLLLFVITNSQMGKVLTIVYCVLNALATPTETVMLPILARGLFGEKSFVKTLGILSAVVAAGQALGGPIMNLAYDIWGDYHISFMVSTLIFVITVGIMNMVMVISFRNKSNKFHQ